ncbi:DnaJ domain-containing protein, partial [Streptomyces spiramenti]
MRAGEPTDHYRLLGLDPGATAAQIADRLRAEHRSWQRLTSHPDLDRRQLAEQRIRDLALARTTLTDPARRAAYDEHLVERAAEQRRARERATAERQFAERAAAHREAAHREAAHREAAQRRAAERRAAVREAAEHEVAERRAVERAVVYRTPPPPTEPPTVGDSGGRLTSAQAAPDRPLVEGRLDEGGRHAARP